LRTGAGLAYPPLAETRDPVYYIFVLGADLQPSSNFFSKFSLTSALLPPANFEEICVPKLKIFPFLLKEKNGAQNQKVWENFSVLEFREFGTAEAEYFIFLLFIFLAASVPPDPTLVAAWNSHIMDKIWKIINC
jgi:hypothetical protein